MSHALAFFDNPHWAIGSINRALLTRWSAGGVLLDWNHALNLDALREMHATHLFCTSGPGLHALHVRYGVPLERICVMTHDEDDFATLRRAFGNELSATLERLHGYAVPSAHLVSGILGHGIRRVPQVVPYGIELSRWTFRPRTALAQLGMAGAYARQSNTGHQNCKRGYLAEQVAQTAGVPFAMTGCGVPDVNAWMQHIDGLIVAGVFEGGPLSPFEAAACGVPTFGTEVGSWTTLGRYAGELLPVNARDFVRRGAERIAYYRDNPSAFAELSYRARAVVERFDWAHIFPEWASFFSDPVHDYVA